MSPKAAAMFLAFSAIATTALASLGAKVDVDICVEATGAAWTITPDITAYQAGFSPTKNATLSGAPWLPDCNDAPDQAARDTCNTCFNTATATWIASSLACSVASGACLFGYVECDSLCLATATYSLWAAMRACYCANIDCSVHPNPPYATIGNHNFAPLVGGSTQAPGNADWNIKDPQTAVTECTFPALGNAAVSTGYGFT